MENTKDTKQQESPPSPPAAGSARLDVNDPDWAELFTLRLDLAARNHGCGMLEMFGRMLGCKRKDIRHARQIDRSWAKKASTRPNTQLSGGGATEQQQQRERTPRRPLK
jgi:hypothetical protein